MKSYLVYVAIGLLMLLFVLLDLSIMGWFVFIFVNLFLSIMAWWIPIVALFGTLIVTVFVYVGIIYLGEVL